MEEMSLKEKLEEAREIFRKQPKCTDDHLRAFDRAIELLELEEAGDLIQLEIDYWEKYYDIIEKTWKTEDGEVVGNSFRIIKEDPNAVEVVDEAEVATEDIVEAEVKAEEPDGNNTEAE